jgi:uncharacterized protein YciI
MRHLFIVVLLIVAASCIAVSQDKQEKKEEPQFKLIQFHMAILKRGPKWSRDLPDAKKIEGDQRQYVSSLLDSGKAVIAGRFTDDGDIRGIYILRAKTPEEAKEWAEASPVVKSGYIIAEIHPWWSEDVMKKPTSQDKMTTAYLGFLKRGPKWTPERTAATEEIQKAHLANINRLAEMKKLVVAGPFGDNGELRGIFVFRVASIEEARSLAETDPAVKAGRLAIEMHPWLVPDEALP